MVARSMAEITCVLFLQGQYADQPGRRSFIQSCRTRPVCCSFGDNHSTIQILVARISAVAGGRGSLSKSSRSASVRSSSFNRLPGFGRSPQGKKLPAIRPHHISPGSLPPNRDCRGEVGRTVRESVPNGSRAVNDNEAHRLGNTGGYKQKTDGVRSGAEKRG